MSTSRQSRELKLQREFAPKGSRRTPWSTGLRFVSEPRRAPHPSDRRRQAQQLRPKWKRTKAVRRDRQRKLTSLWKEKQVDRARGK